MSDLLRTMIGDYLGQKVQTAQISSNSESDCKGPCLKTKDSFHMLSNYSLFSPATRQCLPPSVLSTTPLTSSCCFPFSRAQKRSLSQSTAYPFCLTRCMASLTSFFKATGSWHHHRICCPLIKFNKHLPDFSLLQFSVPGKTPWKTGLSTSRTVFCTLPRVLKH